MPGESRRARLRALLTRAGAKSVDPSAVLQAFVHPSAAREKVEGAQLPSGEFKSNQRLEFLGDTIVGYVAARWLYRHYPEASEGELALRKAHLVSDVALAQSASRLGLGPLLIVGAGHAQSPEGPGRTMLADAFEAFVAALADAAGLDVAATFVEKQHIAATARDDQPGDPKTVLQEWTQKQYRSTPSYADRFEGPAHARTFSARVWVEGEWLAEGSGASKKEAERAAAAAALEVLAQRSAPDAAPAKKGKGLKSSRTRTAKRSRA